MHVCQSKWIEQSNLNKETVTFLQKENSEGKETIDNLQKKVFLII